MSRVRFPVLQEESVPRRIQPSTHYSDHVVQFYVEDASFLELWSRFVGVALASGDSAVAIGTAAHLDRLAQKLKVRGFDITRAIATGRYIPLDAADVLSRFTLEGWPDATRFNEVIGSVIDKAGSAAESEDSRVFIFGEMVALQWGEGKSKSALHLEQLWNNLALTKSFCLHCAYPVGSFDRTEHGESFLNICAAHSTVIPAVLRKAEKA